MWMIITSGLPEEPDTSDWDALCSTPGPRSFLARLLEDRCGVDAGKATATVTSGVRYGDTEVSEGFAGTADAGYRFSEARSLESSMFDVRLTWTTYGVPGIDVQWSFSLEKAGQLGHCAFRNGTLRVRLENDAARATFVRLWHEVFARMPVFSPAD